MKGITNYLELENTLVGVAHSVEDAITEQQQYVTGQCRLSSNG